MSKSDSGIKKNIKDLEHKKILSDYNASLAAVISLTLGFMGITYQFSKNGTIVISIGLFTFFLTNQIRKNIAQRLENKIEEIKSLR